MHQFVDDELLRAPLLFDQVVEGALEHAMKSMASMTPVQRASVSDLIQTLPSQRPHLCDFFMDSLREQVQAELARHAPKPATARRGPPQALALVDEEEIALDVELSHTIQAIKGLAEVELRELQTYTAAMVGDMDVTRDHNPFRAETYARALWASAQGLPVSRGLQVSFMRHACEPLAHLLRRSYAASSSRLESMGIEPAAYRTVILPSGLRRGRFDFSRDPDLHRIRQSMHAPLDEPSARRGAAPALAPGPGPSSRQGASAEAADERSRAGWTAPRRAEAGTAAAGAAPAPRSGPGALDSAGASSAPPGREHWFDVARGATTRADRQAIELVSRLFEAMSQDERVPRDVTLLISRLHGPAMRLALREPALLDKVDHPLWRLLDRMVYAAEMSPDTADPERHQLLKVAQGTIDQLASEPEQNTSLYRWALERLDTYLQKRLQRRVAILSSQTGALQKLEDQLLDGPNPPSTMHGTLDVPQLDTVPAELLEERQRQPSAGDDGEAWIEKLRAGEWLRLFLQGRWVQAQLLWIGGRRDIWLLGDGASDSTWAVRRGAMLMLFSRGLLKALKQRGIVATAAARVQEQVASEPPAG